jgi:hypothetical protein
MVLCFMGLILNASNVLQPELPQNRECASCYNYFMCTGTLPDINRNPEEVQFLRRTESATNYKILTQNGEMIFDACLAIFKKFNHANDDRNYFSRILFLKIWEQLNLTLPRNRSIPFHDAYYEQIVRIIIEFLLDI